MRQASWFVFSNIELKKVVIQNQYGLELFYLTENIVIGKLVIHNRESF